MVGRIALHNIQIPYSWRNITESNNSMFVVIVKQGDASFFESFTVDIAPGNYTAIELENAVNDQLSINTDHLRCTYLTKRIHFLFQTQSTSSSSVYKFKLVGPLLQPLGIFNTQTKTNIAGHGTFTGTPLSSFYESDQVADFSPIRGLMMGITGVPNMTVAATDAYDSQCLARIPIFVAYGTVEHYEPQDYFWFDVPQLTLSSFIITFRDEQFNIVPFDNANWSATLVVDWAYHVEEPPHMTDSIHSTFQQNSTWNNDRLLRRFDAYKPQP